MAQMNSRRIDAYAGMSGYASHLIPVLNALPEERRGSLYAPSNLRHEMPDGTRYDLPRAYESTAPVIVGGYQDIRFAGRRPVCLVNHGAGQRYSDAPDSPSYDGGAGRERVGLFLCPNQASVDANLARYPQARGAAVGCVKLDEYVKIPKPENDPPVVAVAFHWNCVVSPEAGWAFPTWRDAIAELSKSMKVLGHGHPRARRELEPWYQSVGIETAWTVEELLARADVLVVDNSSLGFEWAACDRPTVWLDDETWRDDVKHGLRFGEELPGAVMEWPLSHSAEALAAVVLEFARYPDAPPEVARRRRVLERVYGPVDGKASARAAAAIMDWEQEVGRGAA